MEGKGDTTKGVKQEKVRQRRETKAERVKRGEEIIMNVAENNSGKKEGREPH